MEGLICLLHVILCTVSTAHAYIEMSLLKWNYIELLLCQLNAANVKKKQNLVEYNKGQNYLSPSEGLLHCCFCLTALMHWKSSSSTGNALFCGNALTIDEDVFRELRAISTASEKKKKIPPPWNEDGKERQTERPDVSFSESSSCEHGRCSGTLELQVVGRFNRRWHGAAVSERGDGFWQDGH